MRAENEDGRVKSNFVNKSRAPNGCVYCVKMNITSPADGPLLQLKVGVSFSKESQKPESFLITENYVSCINDGWFDSLLSVLSYITQFA